MQGFLLTRGGLAPYLEHDRNCFRELPCIVIDRETLEIIRLISSVCLCVFVCVHIYNYHSRVFVCVSVISCCFDRLCQRGRSRF